ncbi:helix-turn-helix transcriptional regulator [Poriferisphaera sp. WC338]|uniref:helix-turn-helix transcriptional regulator n=1 Tax=Poriferisphaera sp. WC338 TaxID=3425129 RepID=UPI003D813D90
MQVSKVHRLLKLITIMQGGQPRSVNELMDELSVSRRTLFRDLNLLEAAGVPYYHEKNVGYRISKDFFLPPISLTVPETMGLMILGKTAAAQRDKPLFASALSAIYKLIGTMPEPIRSTCGELMTNISVDPGAKGLGTVETQHYTTLQRCVDEHRTCMITYKSPVEPKPFTAIVHPYALHFTARAWYLFAKTDRHEDIRVLKLARITTLCTMDEHFDRPDDFHISQKIDNAWALSPEGTHYDINLTFLPRVATNVAETHWHPSQKIEMHDDGSCTATFSVNGLREIAWWISGYADQVIINDPPELRTLVHEMLTRAAANHAPDAQPEPEPAI